MAMSFQFGRSLVSWSRVRVCPKCGGHRIRRSVHPPKRVSLLAWFGFSPFRCLDCWERYFARKNALVVRSAAKALDDSFMDERESAKAQFGRRPTLADKPRRNVWLSGSNTNEASYADGTVVSPAKLPKMGLTPGMKPCGSARVGNANGASESWNYRATGED
jgi:hypothetical protein